MQVKANDSNEALSALSPTSEDLPNPPSMPDTASASSINEEEEAPASSSSSSSSKGKNKTGGSESNTSGSAKAAPKCAHKNVTSRGASRRLNLSDSA